MQRWLLALDEPASNPCGSTVIDHEPSGAAIATALAVSGGNQISPDGDGVKLSLHLPNERYACNPDSLYAVPRTDLHEIEWIEPDSVDAEVSRLVAGSSTTTTATRNNPRRCCRTSTSSGYSSHSPPLSAGSYSCYASAVPGQGSFRAAPLAVRDQFGGGLAVIHEGEAIPRPIWPSAFAGPRELYHSDDANPEYDALYACCGCSCAYAYSYCDWDYGQSATTSARDVLLELSRTLNSVIEGETTMTPEEILRNISHTVAQGIGLKGGIYEYIHHNSSVLPSSKKSSTLLSNRNSSVNDKTSSLLSCGKNPSSRVNPVNSKLYSNTRHFYMHNPAWSGSRCTCEHRILSSSKTDERTETSDESGKKESVPAVFLVHEHQQGTKSSPVSQNGKTVNGTRACKCPNRLNYQTKRSQGVYTNRQTAKDGKEQSGLTGGGKQNRNGLSSGEPEYTMQLECSDGGSSSEGMALSSGKSDWNQRLRGFSGDLDFTLDVTRAERLGRAIAKAKRKRQWCRALTALFGLVFFVLSVVVVSLSVTRGRKVFGSM